MNLLTIRSNNMAEKLSLARGRMIQLCEQDEVPTAAPSIPADDWRLHDFIVACLWTAEELKYSGDVKRGRKPVNLNRETGHAEMLTTINTDTHPEHSREVNILQNTFSKRYPNCLRCRDVQASVLYDRRWVDGVDHPVSRPLGYNLNCG